MARIAGMLARDQQPIGRRQAQQLAEWRLIVGEGREHVDVVVDQRGQQHVARVVEHELRAPVGGRHDVLVALQHHLRRAPPVAGGRERRRDRPDHPARVAAGDLQDMGHQGRTGRLAEGPGDHRVQPAARGLAHHLREGSDADAPPARLGDFGIVGSPQLGACAQHQDVEVLRQVGGVEAVVERKAQAFHVRRHRRERLGVRSGDVVPRVAQHQGGCAHAGSGDAGEVDAHHAPFQLFRPRPCANRSAESVQSGATPRPDGTLFAN
jgi:hypothetical protein